MTADGHETRDALDAAIDREVAALTDVNGMAAASRARAMARLAGRKSSAPSRAWRPAVALAGAVGCAVLVWWIATPRPEDPAGSPSPVVVAEPSAPAVPPDGTEATTRPGVAEIASAARPSRPPVLPRRAAPQPVAEELPPLVEPIALAPMESPGAIPVAEIGVATVEVKPILVEAIALPPVDAPEPQH